MKLEALHDNAERAERLLKALANRQRLMILCELHNGERSVSALNAHLNLSQSALSQHLAVLRSDGLVATRRESQTIYYHLANKDASRVIAVLAEIFCDPQTLQSHFGHSVDPTVPE